MPADEPRRRHSRRSEPPLYDPLFEHDACGVGFVADAGGTAPDRVLPLALSGLAALGHRGAFGADGASSDGAGILLPLEPSVVQHLLGGCTDRHVGPRPGVISLFLPRAAATGRRAKVVVQAALTAEGLTPAAWRAVPFDVGVLGPQAAAARPSVVQVVVPRPAGRSEIAFELDLVLARRRMESAARSSGLTSFAVASSSSRTVVYKGLVMGARLAELYPDLAEPLRVSHAVFHQRYATNTMPTWSLAQPFRLVAHNGEINTVRGNREHVRGRSRDRAPSGAARRLLAVGPLLSPDVSDSASLDEAIEILVQTGWSLEAALRAFLPDAPALRRRPSDPRRPGSTEHRHPLAPWDGPAAIVFSDGRRVGGILDRNGLRPLAYAVTEDRLVVAASEAGAFDLPVATIVRRGRLGPGEMLVVEPATGEIKLPGDAEPPVAVAEAVSVDGCVGSGLFVDGVPSGGGARGVHRSSTGADIRFLAGLDAERYRLDIRTMAIEGHEPLWSMGDDTPTPAYAGTDRPVTDHLRQAFAQVTNPPIDAERERAVVDCSVELGPRDSMFAGPPSRSDRPRLRLERPFVIDLDGLLRRAPNPHRLEATWPAARGPGGLQAALERLVVRALSSARRRPGLLVISDRGMSIEHLPIPSVLAVGAVHAALTEAGLRGRTDILLDAADILDVHGAAMAIAAGAGAVHPRLAIELAAEVAGSRGADDLTADEAVARLIDAFEAGLRKTLARMGICTVASYVGGVQFETLELSEAVVSACFPAAPAWPGGLGFPDLAARQLQRAERARDVPAETPPGRLVDPGRARFRADGETHRYAPSVVQLLQRVAEDAISSGDERPLLPLAEGHPASVRDAFRFRGRRPIPLVEVEPAHAIAVRFVAAAMSVGALSPEAHQAVTIGMQRAGGAANTGEGGEDPAWYEPGPAGERRDARIKQVASARFGVTTDYLVRADQLEIKIAQGSKPGEGGQLPARKATAYIAALRRGQQGMAYISPPPHHDIYSIEDLAQLIADLRAVNPTARVGVKLVASRGIGTIAAGVVKSGAAYVHVAGHAGGTGASPLSSIKHVGAPWELGLAEVHQVLLRAGLRDRATLRTDGGLRTGRDIVMAALLGAEEFGLGTAILVALGCDMARQCHLDTCPTGIATQRDDLRAKFRGSPEQVERFVTALAEDVRHELATIGAPTLGEIVGEAARILRPAPGPHAVDPASLLGAPHWPAGTARRSSPKTAASRVAVAPASTVEARLLQAPERLRPGSTIEVVLTTADRAFGAGLAGALARGEISRPLRVVARGAAGQSLGAFLTADIELELEGVANDYVAKGLSGGTVAVRPEADLAGAATGLAIAGNTCLYGATAGRLHLVGRAGIRFCVRNSGAEAVVEGTGPHACEYMTGGIAVILGPTGANLGAGMTGGRAYLWDPNGDRIAAANARSIR
ncbi:MAG: glutamate synthase large subunit, partial [Candidatus Limnocylindrales bacterium]